LRVLCDQLTAALAGQKEKKERGRKLFPKKKKFRIERKEEGGLEIYNQRRTSKAS
jgi:hypothetical protein